MLKNRHIIVLALFAVLVPAHHLRGQTPAQATDRNHRIHGIVTDSTTGSPLEGATVQIPSLQLGAVADKNGRYEIRSIPHGIFSMRADFLGYKTSERIISIENDRRIDFALSPTVLELEGVTVTARGTSRDEALSRSQSMTVLSGTDLEKARGQTIGETLEAVPGVTTMQTGVSISKPVVRGLHSQRIVVLNAGIQQEGQQWGGEHAPEIDPFTPAKITVVRGASAVEYGAGAIGGVIKLEPRKLPEEASLGGEIVLQGFSNNRQGAVHALTEGGIPGADGYGWRVEGGYRRAGNGATPDYVLGNTGFEETSISAAAGYHDDETGADIYASHFATTLGIFRGSHIGTLSDFERILNSTRPLQEYPFTYDILAPRQDIAHTLLSVRAHHTFHSIGTFEVTYGWQQNSRKEFDVHRAFSADGTPLGLPAFDLELTTYSIDAKLLHAPLGRLAGSIGASGMRQGNVNSGLSALIPNFSAYSGSVYLIEGLHFTNATLSTGVRFDYRDATTYRTSSGIVANATRTYSSVSGTAGADIQLTDALAVSFNAGTAWRPPSVNELFAYGVHHGTAQFEIGNPNLSPERSIDLSLTLRYNSDKVSGEISSFKNRMYGFISLLPRAEPTLTLRGIFPTFEYKQTDAILQGIDGYVRHDFTEALSFTVKGALLWGDNMATNEPLFQMPAHRAGLDFEYRFGKTGALEDLVSELSVLGVAKQTRVPRGFDYAPPPPGYVLVGLRLYATFTMGRQHFSLQLAASNLLNRRYRDYLSRYRYFVDEPGRDVVLRILIPFGKTVTM